MFFNVFVCIGSAVVISIRRTNQPEAQLRFIDVSARKKYNNKEKRFKTNLYMHNTNGDVTLPNIYALFYKNNSIRTTRLKFGQKLRTT